MSSQQQQQQQQLKFSLAIEQGPLRGGSKRYDTTAHSPFKPQQQQQQQQQRFSPTMNRPFRSSTIDGSGRKASEIPDIFYTPDSPLVAKARSDRRRSALQGILERNKKSQEQQEQQAMHKSSRRYSKDRLAAQVNAYNYTVNGPPLPQPPARQTRQPAPFPPPENFHYPPAVSQSPSSTATLDSASRQVFKAELQFRSPTKKPEQRASLGLASKPNRSSLLQKRAEQSMKLLSESMASAASESSKSQSGHPEALATVTDELGAAQEQKQSLPSSPFKQTKQYPYRVERSYRIADHSKDSKDEGAGMVSDKDPDNSPPPSPLSIAPAQIAPLSAFSLPPVQQPPPQKDLPPLPLQLQQQLQQLPRLSPPRKLPYPNAQKSQLGLLEPGVKSPSALLAQSSNRRVVSGSSIVRAPSKLSIVDNQPGRDVQMLGPNQSPAQRAGKGQATEVFRRVGYWLYTTAPVQFIKHAIVEERTDNVDVLYTTDKSIWILGVSYRLKKNKKSVILPVALDANSSHLQMDSSLFLDHHQKRSISPNSSQQHRKLSPKHHKRIDDALHRRRANTSGVVANKKKLQGIAQIHQYPGATAGAESSSSISPTNQLLANLAQIAPNEVLGTKRNPTSASSPPWIPTPVANDILDFPSKVDIEPETQSVAASTQTQSQQQAPLERPKSSKMNRLRSWVSRNTNPMRRKSDAAETAASILSGTGSSSKGVDGGNVPPVPQVSSSVKSRPSSPQSSRVSTETKRPTLQSLGLSSGPIKHLRRKSRELAQTAVQKAASGGKRRSWFDADANTHQPVPPVPSIYSSASTEQQTPPRRSFGDMDRPAVIGRSSSFMASAAMHQKRPRSSQSNHLTSPRRIISGGSFMFSPTRREAHVRALVSEFAAWESPAASVMMFQREWKLPSFQQVVSIPAATTWARDNNWTVTLCSESFFMAYIFYNLPRDPGSHSGHLPGEKIFGDRLLLRMRVALEDIEGRAVAGEAWRDAMTAIILTIDARVAPNCPVNIGNKRNLSQSSVEMEEHDTLHRLPAEDNVKRMKILEKHMAKITDSFSQHFWPRQHDDQQSSFNTFPRSRNEHSGGSNANVSIDKKPRRRARGWNMIPTLLSFKSDAPSQSETAANSAMFRKRQLYPAGLSIPSTGNAMEQRESSQTSHELSPSESATDMSSYPSRPDSPTPHSPPRSPVQSSMTLSLTQKRSSQVSQVSGRAQKPTSPLQKRGALGLFATSNDADTLADDLSNTLSISSKSPVNKVSTRQSSGESSGHQRGASMRMPSPNSAAIGADSARKRKPGDDGAVGKPRGGFEVVWSATDDMSTSYVMVPVPRTRPSESPTKMQKQSHSKRDAADPESLSNHSQPNLKETLESITREINMDSSYVLLLPPPPPMPIDSGLGDGREEAEDDDDEFGYLTPQSMLRKAKSEMGMRRTLHEFEQDYGLDKIDLNDNDSDSFQLVDASDDSHSHNSVYFSAEDDSMVEADTWYKRLSNASSQYQQHRHKLQQMHEHEMLAQTQQPLSLNQLTLLEFFLDGMRRFYFTYRKGFPTITPSFYTSDMGWGCTYRTCQMMLAESFARVSLGRFWDPFRLNAAQHSRHGMIIEWFHDTDAQNAHYSIHRMSRTATEMDKRIGDWLGPSIAAHVMKRLSNKHPGCPLTIHVALDQTVYASEVRKQALAREDGYVGPPCWKPLLLLVPVRLGLERLNLGYIPKLKTLFQIPQSVGLVGGKPSRSFYFIGRQGDNLFYLDPHVTRQHVPRSTVLDGQRTATAGSHDGHGYDSDSSSSDFELFGIPDTDEYHTSHIRSMPIYRLDPSMLLGFLFNTEAEWDTFAMAATDKESQRSICTGSTPLFTLMSGSNMMIPPSHSVVQQPIPGHITKVAAQPEIERRPSHPASRPQSRPGSPVRFSTPRAAPTFSPPLPTSRSASSPKSGAALGLSTELGLSRNGGESDDDFEML